jgi:hypothetical protein
MKSHVESKIDAGGRIYEIRCFDRSNKPFEVSVETHVGKVHLATYATRTEAINLSCARANQWLRGDHFNVDLPVQELS